MKPVNHPYRGMWGSYKVGLPFYRAFCGTNVSIRKCQDATYNELLAWPSIKNMKEVYEKKAYLSIALDNLCPRNSTSSDYETCYNEVVRSEYDKSQTSFPFLGPELTCFKENCHWGMNTTRRRGRKIHQGARRQFRGCKVCS